MIILLYYFIQYITMKYKLFFLLIILSPLSFIDIEPYMEPAIEVYEIHEIKQDIEIGFVNPIFTINAYLEGNYYDYFANNSLDPAKHLNIEIDRTIKKHPQFMNNVSKIENITVTYIDDITVHNNEIGMFDILIFVHNEYVTLQEYHNMIEFMNNGGKVILLDGNSFFVEVEYKNNMMKLINGKGRQNITDTWIKGDVSAFYNPDEPLQSMNYIHIGSHFAVYRGEDYTNNFVYNHPIGISFKELYDKKFVSDVGSYEDNKVINPNADMIIKWSMDIKMYQLNNLIHFGIFASNYMHIVDIYNLFILSIYYMFNL